MSGGWGGGGTCVLRGTQAMHGLDIRPPEGVGLGG